jgi:hypothetical protein
MLTFTNCTPASWKAVREAVVKSLYRVPMPMTTSASAAMRFAAVVPVAPMPPRYWGWSQVSEPPPAWVVPTGMPRGADGGDGSFERPALGDGATDVPLPRLQELLGDVDPLRLDVLGQGDGHGAGLGRVGQHPHGGEGDREQLLGPVDPVEEARQRPERVGDLQRGVVLQQSLTRVAKVSLGSRSAGRRLVVARAAAVSMLAAPGPTEAVLA